jgi:drug/metabolite transporter (DMT)-like permease
LRDEVWNARRDATLGEFGHGTSVAPRRDSAVGPDRRRGVSSDTLGLVNRSHLAGIALVVASAVAFGSGGLFAKPVYAAGVDWLTLMAWRFAIAGSLAWVVLAARPGARRALAALPRRTVLATIGLGVFYVSNTATYYAGIQTVPLGLSALIVYLYPPVVAMLALRLGRPLVGRRVWTALGVALLGVVLAVGGIDPAAAPPAAGLALIVASPLLYSVWIILAARHSGERSDRVGRAAEEGASASAVGALMLSSTAVFYWVVCLGTGHPVLPTDVTGEAWPGILAVGVVAGYVPVQAFYAGAQRIGAAQASLVSTVEPLWTIVAAAAIYGERLQPVQLMGGALILVGVVLSQTGGRRGGRGRAADVAPLPQPLVRLAEE